MTSDAGVYLSSYQTMTVFLMRDLVAGRRRLLRAADVKYINVPQFDGLSIEDMLDFARVRTEAPMDVFPMVPRELEKLPRQYIANCIFTIVGKPFQDWIKARMEERNRKITHEKATIEMDSQIAAIYQASTAISSE